MNHLLTGRSRFVAIKTRSVRHTAKAAPLATHLGYLRREGVTRDAERAGFFGPDMTDADSKALKMSSRDTPMPRNIPALSR